MSSYERALQIAADAHAGQVDKAGAPYIQHPLRVSASVQGADEKIVALLHDVVEDSTWTLDDLRQENFSEPIVSAVDALTHREGEAYRNAIQRAKADPLARVVKMADLTDNMDRSRLGSVTEKDEARLAKYAAAYAVLSA